jgi:hypothetical protein
MAARRKFVPTPRGTSFRTAFAVMGLGMALGLSGCGDPTAGGGTELPIQVRIFVDADANAWRLWTVEEENPVAARGLSTSRTFVSRGVLQDSAGILSLPATPGLFLLEAWIHNAPPESLVVVHDIPDAFRLDETCIQSVPLDHDIVRTQVCPSLDRTLAPSSSDSASRPERLTLIRIEGSQVQRVQILDDAGAARLLPAEARLWEVSPDSTQDQTLLFRGVLDRESDGSFRLPTRAGFGRYLIEASETRGALPRTVPAHSVTRTGWTRFMACQESVLAPLPSTLSVHSCPGLGWTLSGSTAEAQGADLWSAFSLSLP